MNDYITEEEYCVIEDLVHKAVTARNKAEATPYIKQLEFRSDEYCGYTRCVYSNLVASTMRASGQVNDKQRLLSFCNTDLHKLSLRIKRTSRDL